jgi:hypothetical protein
VLELTLAQIRGLTLGDMANHRRLLGTIRLAVWGKPETIDQAFAGLDAPGAGDTRHEDAAALGFQIED